VMRIGVLARKTSARDKRLRVALFASNAMD
jgi:hypothetical protein